MVSMAAAIISGVAQFFGRKPTRETWPATIGLSIVATPSARELPPPTQELTAASPTATPQLTAAPPAAPLQFTSSPTPRQTPAEQHRKKRRTRPETTQQTDPVADVPRALFPP